MKISTFLRIVAVIGTVCSLALIGIGAAAISHYGFGFVWLGMIVFGVVMSCAGGLYLVEIDRREIEEQNRRVEEHFRNMEYSVGF